MDLPTARPPHLPRPFAPGRAGARVREAFEAFDGGRKGWLERRELKCAMAALLGYRPSRLWDHREQRWSPLLSHSDVQLAADQDLSW